MRDDSDDTVVFIIVLQSKDNPTGSKHVNNPTVVLLLQFNFTPEKGEQQRTGNCTGLDKLLEFRTQSRKACRTELCRTLHLFFDLARFYLLLQAMVDERFDDTRDERRLQEHETGVDEDQSLGLPQFRGVVKHFIRDLQIRLRLAVLVPEGLQVFTRAVRAGRRNVGSAAELFGGPVAQCIECETIVAEFRDRSEERQNRFVGNRDELANCTQEPRRRSELYNSVADALHSVHVVDRDREHGPLHS
mmetsp:Transcript_22013/g.68877  ORF Transcript_22013/g.68877 Transcript_22013/m.68877 type:complete len:246 (+) Transcript_22013:1763-2500(+)